MRRSDSRLATARCGLFLTLRPPLVRWIGVRKELPFAGYSVVKEPPRRKAPRQTLVENTGLEPVTSWLQTRRSPS